MANDYIPRGDADFNAWQANFVTPTRKAKPAGVMGAEIWVKIGPTPPVDPSELTFLAVDTRKPYTTDFERGRRRQAGPLHASLGQHARRNRPVERDGQRDRAGIGGYMWINKTVTILTGVLGLFALPVGLLTMNIVGCLVGCMGQFVILIIPAIILLGLSLIWPSLREFSLIALGIALVGLLILPALSLIWLPFYAILVALSRLYRAAPWLSLPVGILGIPFAVVGSTFVGWIPYNGRIRAEMGEGICLR